MPLAESPNPHPASPEAGANMTPEQQIADVTKRLQGRQLAQFNQSIDTFNAARRRHEVLAEDVTAILTRPDYKFNPKTDKGYRDFEADLDQLGRPEVDEAVERVTAYVAGVQGIPTPTTYQPGEKEGAETRVQRFETQRNKRALELLGLALGGAGDEYRELIKDVACQKALGILRRSNALSPAQRAEVARLATQAYTDKLPIRLAELLESLHQPARRKLGRKALGKPVIDTEVSDDEKVLEPQEALDNFTRFTKAFNGRLNPSSPPHAHPAAPEIKQYLESQRFVPPTDPKIIYEELTSEAVKAYGAKEIDDYLIEASKTKVLPLLYQMGLLEGAVAESQTEPAVNEGEAIRKVIADIENRIADMKARGVSDQKAFWELSKEWHPDSTSESRDSEAMIYINQRFHGK